MIRGGNVLNNSSISEFAITRKEFIPVWMKLSGYFFMIVTIVSILAIPLSYLTSVHLDLYGIFYSSQGISPELIGIILISLFITIGFWGILTAKKWSLIYSTLVGFSLLTYFVLRFLISIMNGPIEIRLEPLLIGFFLLKIQLLKRNWTAE